MKTILLEDVVTFLDPEMREWYARYGIPYKRGYLFYGSLGTGKSSFSLSVAGRFSLDVYFLSLSGIGY